MWKNLHHNSLFARLFGRCFLYVCFCHWPGDSSGDQQSVPRQDTFPFQWFFLFSVFRSIKPAAVYEFQSLCSIRYVMMCNQEDHTFLVLGPCLTAPYSKTAVQAVLEKHPISVEKTRQIIDICSRLPVISPATLQELGSIPAHYLLHISQPVPYQFLEIYHVEREQPAVTFVENYDELFQMRQTEQRYEWSAAMTGAVKQGHLPLAYHFLQGMDVDSDTIVRNPDPLRNAQNLCIIMNTQLRYAMEEVRIHPYQLDRISHSIALQIEKLRSVVEARQYSFEILRQYCELARENIYSGLCSLVKLAIIYQNPLRTC